MLKDFDIAFTNKIKGWFSNTIYANTALVYNVAYNLVDDPKTVLKFPLISIYRPAGFELDPVQTFAARKQGIEYYYDDVSKKSSMARFLVAKLPYQIDVYTKTPESLDDITEDIMQALNLDTKLRVIQEDSSTGQVYDESYDIVYSNGAAEQSEFANDDRVYHYSMVYEIRSARLVNFRTVPTVEDITIEVSVDDD